MISCITLYLDFYRNTLSTKPWGVVTWKMYIPARMAPQNPYPHWHKISGTLLENPTLCGTEVDQNGTLAVLAYAYGRQWECLPPGIKPCLASQNAQNGHYCFGKRFVGVIASSSLRTQCVRTQRSHRADCLSKNLGRLWLAYQLKLSYILPLSKLIGYLPLLL